MRSSNLPEIHIAKGWQFVISWFYIYINLDLITKRVAHSMM